MKIEDYFDFFENGDIRIREHRIGIEDVLYEHQLAVRFPTLSPCSQTF